MLLFTAVVALLAAGTARVLEDVIITPDDGAAKDRFGTAVGASGNKLVVGASQDDGFIGSAYVFVTADGGSSWTQEAKLAAPDAESDDTYGSSVAVDGNFVVVGAIGNDDGGSGSGSAYIHTTSDGGSTWSAGVKITAADAASHDQFGKHVAISGNVVVVGASQDDTDNGSNSGSVYIFVTSDGGTSWAQTDKISASDGADFDRFGTAVDFDGSIMVIGARGDDDAGGGSGSAYVFRSTDGGSTWAQAAKLTANDGAAADNFGSAVAVAGSMIAVGAPNDQDGGFFSAGSVYAFKTSDGGLNWSQSAKLVSDAPAVGDNFGTSVAASGNLIVVGAPYADTEHGIAFVFETDDGGDTWALVEKMSASDADGYYSSYYYDDVGTELGVSVAVDGGLVFAGAQDRIGDKVGAVYVLQHGAAATESASHSESASATHSASASASPTASPTASPDAGSVGDPILVDFAGHRFLGGARGRTEYLLYRSQDDAEAITMTTGSVRGNEGGFFAAGVSVSQAGCGSVQVLALTGHAADITGDACMTSRLAHGDSGLVLIPVGHGGEAGSVLAVSPHQQGSSPAFVNLKLLGTTAAFRAGCTGMLCNEAHGDVEA